MIKLKNVSYIYQKGGPFEKTAVSDINLNIESGEFVGLIGHTGSGKSTLIQMLNGLLTPTSGKIYVDGKDLSDKKTSLRDVRFKVGLVMQYPEYQLFEETVYRDIAFGPANMGLPKEEIDNRVRYAACLVGINDDVLEKSPFELSGGQKRRVAIAGVLAMQTKALVLDEPTAGLDPAGREEILHKIRDMHRETGMTVILVSHSMEDIARFAGRIIVMNQGRVELTGTPSEIFSRAEFLEDIGLSAPQITKVMLELKRRGFDVSDGIYEMETAKAEVLKIL